MVDCMAEGLEAEGIAESLVGSFVRSIDFSFLSNPLVEEVPRKIMCGVRQY